MNDIKRLDTVANLLLRDYSRTGNSNILSEYLKCIHAKSELISDDNRELVRLSKLARRMMRDTVKILAKKCDGDRLSQDSIDLMRELIGLFQEYAFEALEDNKLSLALSDIGVELDKISEGISDLLEDVIEDVLNEELDEEQRIIESAHIPL